MVFSAATFVIAIVGWLAIFSIALVSNAGLEAALPNEIIALKENYGRSAYSNAQHIYPDVRLHPPAIEIFGQQEIAQYRCIPPEITENRDQVEASKKWIYAVLPTAFPWAPYSLDQSCDAVNVVMPTWLNASVVDGTISIGIVSQGTREPLRDYIMANGPDVHVMPIIDLDAASTSLVRTPQGRSAFALAMTDFLGATKLGDGLLGYCLAADGLTSSGATAFAGIVQLFTATLRKHALASCVSLPSTAPDHVLVIANRYFDTVVVKGYQEAWVGSTPQPLAADSWFEAHITSLKSHVSPEKLVVELGTFAVDWVSGRPQPEKRSFAQVMSALADAQIAPEFVSEMGNTSAVYVDADGLQHRIWMLDAASAHNQMQTLDRLRVTSIGLSGLGYEDPGIWAVIDQAKRGLVLSGSTLEKIVFSNYVEQLGQGPFVAPVAMPRTGNRLVLIEPVSNLVTSVKYTTIPRASVARLYGKGPLNKVVLTFDDGPDPRYTADTLDILQSTETPAAFFVLGHNAIKSPKLLERILADGHELGSHTYWHPKMGEISASRATAEVNSVQLLVSGITGKRMRLYREPYMRSGGPITSKEVASLMPLEKAGYIIAGMDIVPRDWLVQSSDQLADEIIKQVEAKAGGVVLLHDGGGDQSQTVAALPKVISTLRNRGYEFTSIAEFLKTTPEVLMPDSDQVTSTLSSLSFFAVGNSWSILEIIFWMVFGIGIFRSILLLALMARRTGHIPAGPEYQPSVTIVIPAFNEAHVIQKCISSALASRYTDFNIIVVDDGSTDNTYDKAMAFAAHPLVKVISQPNSGKASALNVALDEAQSEVLICIDADSQISPNAVGQLAAHFHDPKVGAVAGRVIVGNRNNILTRLQAIEYITAQSVERRAKEYLNSITVVPGAIGAWRATAVMEAGIFSTETLTEDADMTMAIIRSNYQVVYEERAFAITETPATLKSLMTQRLRWSLGMMQAAWKHLGAIAEGRNLGIFSLFDLAIFGYLMPIVAPLADLFLLILAADFITNYGSTSYDAATVLTNPLVIAYLALPLLELFTVFIAFKFDPREDRRLMLLLPVQRLFYRQVLYISVFRALWRAATGSLANWGRSTRVGIQFDETHLT